MTTETEELKLIAKIKSAVIELDLTTDRLRQLAVELKERWEKEHGSKA